jgi:hypothetical protein
LANRYFGKPVVLSQLSNGLAFLTSGKNLAVSHRILFDMHARAPHAFDSRAGIPRFVGQGYWYFGPIEWN